MNKNKIIFLRKEAFKQLYLVASPLFPESCSCLILKLEILLSVTKSEQEGGGVGGLSQMSNYPFVISHRNRSSFPAFLSGGLSVPSTWQFHPSQRNSQSCFLSNCLVLFFQTTTLLLPDFGTSFSMPVTLSDHISLMKGEVPLASAGVPVHLAPNKRQFNPTRASSTSTVVTGTQGSRKPRAL